MNERRDDDGGGNGRGAIVALVLLLILVVGGVYLSGALRSSNRVQDCVMAGRTNCAPVTPGS